MSYGDLLRKASRPAYSTERRLPVDYTQVFSTCGENAFRSQDDDQSGEVAAANHKALRHVALPGSFYRKQEAIQRAAARVQKAAAKTPLDRLQAQVSKQQAMLNTAAAKKKALEACRKRAAEKAWVEKMKDPVFARMQARCEPVKTQPEVMAVQSVHTITMPQAKKGTSMSFKSEAFQRLLADSASRKRKRDAEDAEVQTVEVKEDKARTQQHTLIAHPTIKEPKREVIKAEIKTDGNKVKEENRRLSQQHQPRARLIP